MRNSSTSCGSEPRHGGRWRLIVRTITALSTLPDPKLIAVLARPLLANCPSAMTDPPRESDSLKITLWVKVQNMERTSKYPFTGILTAASVATGASAVFAASCCVLPLALGGLGAGAGLFSVLEVLADYRIPILVLSAALLAVAWTVYLTRRGARSTALALIFATFFVGSAAAWDRLEPPLLKIVRAHR